jgi:DNA invertase Pin-like site-specific DNA recombinase
MTTALIYIRQSRNKAYEHTVSPEVQEEMCRALPAVRRCEQIEVFSDLDVSGGKLKGRGRFSALLERVKSADKTHEPFVVAAYDQSRLSRSNVDSLTFYALVEERPWVDVVLVDGHFERSPSGELTWAVMAATAAHLRKTTGKKIREAYGHLNARGAATGMPPFGYRRGSDGRLEVVDDEARVVRRIFDLYASGELSAKAIADRLSAEGITRRLARNPYGWVPDTVVDTLRNVAYVGKTFTVSRAKQEGEIITAQWPLIIEESTFNRVQALMGDRRVFRVSSPKEHTFGRLLVCSECGSFMRATRTHGHTYYYCRRDVPAAVRCSAPSVREDGLEAWASSLFARLEALQPAQFAQSVRAAGTRRESPTGSVESVARSQEKLEKLFMWGHLTEAAYLRQRATLDALRVDLATTSTAPLRMVDLSGLRSHWARASASERRTMLRDWFERLYVADGTVRKFVARDHSAVIQELIEQAVGDGVEYEEPLAGRGRYSSEGRGKGGIRTLEGALHPLPA